MQGGAGGVGGFAIQIAAKLGLEVITTASARNFEWVQSLGATWCIDYGTESTAERIAQITKGNGVEAILDTVGRETSTEGLAMLTFSGGLACVATLPDLETYRQSGKALSLHDINLGGGLPTRQSKSNGPTRQHKSSIRRVYQQQGHQPDGRRGDFFKPSAKCPNPARRKKHTGQNRSRDQCLLKSSTINWNKNLRRKSPIKPKKKKAR